MIPYTGLGHNSISNFIHTSVLLPLLQIVLGADAGMGISGAMEDWGSILRTRYGKDPAATRAADYTLSHLGYSTGTKPNQAMNVACMHFYRCNICPPPMCFPPEPPLLPS